MIETCTEDVLALHFTLCIQNRKLAFVDPVVIKAFTQFLVMEAKKASCKVPVYCFMPDHLHLIIEGTSQSSDIWKTVVSYKQKTGFWLASNRPGIKWQKDFYDHLLRSDEKLSVHARYILNNPVREGITSSWAGLPFSRRDWI